MLRDGRVDWSNLVKAVKTLLLDRIVNSEDEIADKAMSVTQIRLEVLGDAHDDDTNAQLNQLVNGVVGIATKGRLQKSLENGYVLCSVRVDKVPVRFISGDADLVDRFNTQPQVTSAVRRTEAAYAAINQNTRRVALLTPRKPLLLQKAQEQLATAMPLDGQS